MSANFDKAFEIVIGVEGGYVNDPRDPGGETKFGITKRSYPNEDIKNLTLDRAKQIYASDYWTPIQGDELPWPLALFLFDMQVNQGPYAIATLQKTLGLTQDGVFGNKTQQAVHNADQMELCSLFMADRALRYLSSHNFSVYGRGWIKRLFTVTMKGD